MNRVYNYLSTIAFILTIYFCASCQSNILDSAFNPDTHIEQMKSIKLILARDDFKVFESYLNNVENKEILAGKSYRQLYNEAITSHNESVERIGKLADSLEKSASKISKSNKPGLDLSNYSGQQLKDVQAVNSLLIKYSNENFKDSSAKRVQMYSKNHKTIFLDYLNQAKKISKEEFMKLNVIDAVALIKIKSEFSPDELMNMSNEDMYKIHLEKDVQMIRENTGLSEVKIHSDDYITGHFIIAGTMKKQILFNKENGQWKLSTYDDEDEKIRKEKETSEQLGTTTEAFLATLVENVKF